MLSATRWKKMIAPWSQVDDIGPAGNKLVKGSL